MKADGLPQFLALKETLTFENNIYFLLLFYGNDSVLVNKS